MEETDIGQQDFLREAMETLNMTRDELAKRIGVNRRRLDNWLLPDESKGHRPMEEMAWKFIKEILKGKRKKT
jgi:transcriptional regulator with XRE-family HTH domain